jgi:hypothetical protein
MLNSNLAIDLKLRCLTFNRNKTIHQLSTDKIATSDDRDQTAHFPLKSDSDMHISN